MKLLAILLIGFSIFTALILIVNDSIKKLELQPYSSKLAGFILIICLAAIQYLNLQAILHIEVVDYSTLYVTLLYCIAPSFFFYSCWILTAKINTSPWQFLHAVPFLTSLFFASIWAIPMAFIIGSGYLLWLARAVYCLRQQRNRFKLEFLALSGFFCIAIAVVVLGFIWPLVSKSAFHMTYSILIGLAFFAAGLTLICFPTIKADVAETSQATYTESTLKKIDCKKILDQLNQLMQQEKLFRLETLSLAMLAEQLQLNSHQLSELINTEFQMGFSKCIRQYRIAEAKILLIEQPKSSVLSIGLSVGFNSQSNFYTAFREFEGMALGQFRKQFIT